MTYKTAFGTMENKGYNKAVLMLNDSIDDSGSAHLYGNNDAEAGRAMWNMLSDIGTNIIINWNNERVFCGTVAYKEVQSSMLNLACYGVFDGTESAVPGMLVLATAAADPGTNLEGSSFIGYTAYIADSRSAKKTSKKEEQ